MKNAKMSNTQKRCEGKTIAVYSWVAFSGIEIEDIEYGIKDYVYCTTSDGKCHRLRIRTNANGSPYFTLQGQRIKLEDCMKVA